MDYDPLASLRPAISMLDGDYEASGDFAWFDVESYNSGPLGDNFDHFYDQFDSYFSTISFAQVAPVVPPQASDVADCAPFRARRDTRPQPYRLRFSAEELSLLRQEWAACNAHGKRLSLHRFIILKCLSHSLPIIPMDELRAVLAALRAILAELRKQGRNLNPIAALAETHFVSPETTTVVENTGVVLRHSAAQIVGCIERLTGEAAP